MAKYYFDVLRRIFKNMDFNVSSEIGFSGSAAQYL